LKFYFENGDIVYSVDTQILGSYNFENAMAAVAVGKYFNVDLFDVKTALEEYTPTNKRSQIKETEHNSLILDCYNANPSSMKVAIENFGEMKTANNKVVILGAMKELGIDSESEDRNVVEIINKYRFDKIILIGNEFSFAPNMQNENFKWFATTIEAKDFLTNYNITNSTILLKGSNSMKIDSLEEIF
jgi:UDP-N-acetylmuramoyl-tripeptide--D-alanyl-D-alanine ligase